MDIRKDDKVVVLSGKDKGKEGKILSVDPTDMKVIVEGVNKAKRHKKPRKQGDPGGIITKETPIYASKVMRVCPKCNKPTRPAHLIKKAAGKDKEDVKVRVCKKCGAEI
jgi:large subunit ribosomal protein L24